jgi:hypothetical protein
MRNLHSQAYANNGGYMNWTWIIGLSKWVAIVVTFAMAILALFRGTYHEDSETKKRTPTPEGWTVLAVLSVSFIISVAASIIESIQNASDAKAKQEQINVQKEQIASLRKIALGQKDFAGLQVTLTFPEERIKGLMKQYSSVDPFSNEPLFYEDGEVGYIPYEQDTKPGVETTFGENDDEYKDFNNYVNSLCSKEFRIELNGKTNLASMTSTRWPSAIKIEGNEITLTFEKPAIKLDALDDATVTFHMEIEEDKAAPTHIFFESLDKHVVFPQRFEPKWQRYERDEEDKWRAPIKVAYLVSKPQALAVEFQDIFPQKRTSDGKP